MTIRDELIRIMEALADAQGAISWATVKITQMLQEHDSISVANSDSENDSGNGKGERKGHGKGKGKGKRFGKRKGKGKEKGKDDGKGKGKDSRDRSRSPPRDRVIGARSDSLVGAILERHDPPM